MLLFARTSAIIGNLIPFLTSELALTANQITLIVVPVMVCLFVVRHFLNSRKRKNNQNPKVHGPHTPGAGYDVKEIARSNANGLGGGSVG